MKRNLHAVEYEIVRQIFLSELCFDICSLKCIPGRGSDFLPYYYNLNFTKGLLSLHSLLLSSQKNELSLKNYIIECKKLSCKENIEDFEKNLALISERFRHSSSEPLRHKIAAHIDENYINSEFTCAYLTPHLVPKYVQIVSDLKSLFFLFCNFANDHPFQKIKEQSEVILKSLA